MSPTLKELNIIPGEGVRVKPGYLPSGHNPREVFTVVEAPAHGLDGAVVLNGRLTDLEVIITAGTDALVEKTQ